MLIAASANWAETENCLSIKYESLVDDAEVELKRVTDQLLPASAEVISAAVVANSLTRLRSCVQNQHFWQGQPGIWKTLLPSAVAQDIERHHASAFATMGYASVREQSVSSSEADANWTALELATMRQEMAESRVQLKQATNELNQARWQIRDLEVEFREAAEKINPLIEISPTILNVSERVNRVTRFCGGAAASIRRHLGMGEKRVGKRCEV
ncbi:MAG TPA: hypothetical protein VMM76_11400 [Pirellulaceae bacterium]|nr:hypothetical protein [Pirellulaceae bacterium]